MQRHAGQARVLDSIWRKGKFVTVRVWLGLRLEGCCLCVCMCFVLGLGLGIISLIVTHYGTSAPIVPNTELLLQMCSEKFSCTLTVATFLCAAKVKAMFCICMCFGFII